MSRRFAVLSGGNFNGHRLTKLTTFTEQKINEKQLHLLSLLRFRYSHTWPSALAIYAIAEITSWFHFTWDIRLFTQKRKMKGIHLFSNRKVKNFFFFFCFSWIFMCRFEICVTIIITKIIQKMMKIRKTAQFLNIHKTRRSIPTYIHYIHSYRIKLPTKLMSQFTRQQSTAVAVLMMPPTLYIPLISS